MEFEGNGALRAGGGLEQEERSSEESARRSLALQPCLHTGTNIWLRHRFNRAFHHGMPEFRYTEVFSASDRGKQGGARVLALIVPIRLNIDN